MASIYPSKRPLYRTWRTMHASCYNVGNPSFPYVGGKGIQVCPRWHNFEYFEADVKIKVLKHFFTRINKAGDFHPGNWRWMSVRDWKRTSQTCKLTKEKATAMRAAYIHDIDGTITLKELARQFGCSTTTAHSVVHYQSWV